MNLSNRRSFIKTIATGTAASILFPHLTAQGSTGTLEAFDLKKTKDDSETFWENIKSQFHFAPGLRYFNNASLGSSPKPIKEATDAFTATLNGFPSKYMWGGWSNEKERVREKVAGLFSVSEEEIAITHNTTEGFNLIAKSFDLKAGDEIILANHEHASGTIPWKAWQETKGVKLVRPVLPVTPKTVKEIVAVYEKAITPKTKIISMCHIVNTNGMILPVKEVSEMAHKKGILVAVDGAQSAGMFSIDLHDLGCDFFTASAHKWLFAPKGIGVFYAKQSSQHHLKPLIVAHGYENETIRRLENYNTRNLPEYLGLGAAVEFHNAIGKDKITKRSYELKHYFRDQLKDNPKFKLKSPEDDRLSCAIQTVELVGKNVADVKNQLTNDYGIDTRPMSTFGLNGVRISFGMYITKKDIDDLVKALKNIAG
ncbi:aminotransferase class V-fold PLP-dependent enzyme [Winogradskyella immobilis]|uniref:Aminotransferase class V-fold PLP-dependent enzyme n=1 Tax=Winogradskyella immobilis TaxID=2816852 RepID=A0ABS8EPX4_9FLAO|nr:aminotransferase class V-fold PLP-dependent enzyme [Winogradskyella immobilis]MCC1485042.1 aminotransferase class V-fold PLP-dependent enzyme [Winogradskyella immobilis]MCG0017134.1 aminotransferase class V-fold PLP-dependent enzyme [Winogradskyella immobilis]